MNEKPKISSFTIILAFVCLSLAGVALIPLLTVKLSPSQVLPNIYVNFSMANSSPRVVEMEATSKLEAMLNRIKGVQSISSTSSNGRGNISLRFDKHTDMDMARFEVSNTIRQTWPLLPANVSYPTISLSRSDNNANRPFLTYTVIAPATPLLIQQFAEKQIKNKLAQIDGVYRIDVSGAQPMEWQLEYDYKQLENLGVNVYSISAAIGEYMDKDFLGTGYAQSVDEESQWIRIALLPERSDWEIPFGEIEVKSGYGEILALDKILKITRREAKPRSYYRINGLNSIYLSITAEETANQLTLSKKIKEQLEQIKPFFPYGYDIYLNYDATELIKKDLDKIYFRTGLTLAILLVFVMLSYRNIRYILMVILSLFLNLAIAVIFYYLFGIEIQLYSLAGITISLTLIIDNTIIMSDQILMQKNKKAFLAILAATATTIASLSVIFFLDERLRLNLMDFARVIIINLALSLLVALFLVPALLDKMGIGRQTENKIPSRLQKFKARVAKKIRPKRLSVHFNHVYATICRFIYRWKVAFVIFIILAFGLPVFLLPDKMDESKKHAELYNKTFGSSFYKEKIKPYSDVALGGTLRLFSKKTFGRSFFTDRGETMLYVTATLPSNATIEQMNNLVQRMESYISQIPEIRQFQTNIYSANQAQIIIRFPEKHQRGGYPELVKNRLTTKGLELGGGSWSIYGVGQGFSNNVQDTAGNYRVELYGYNYDELMVYAEQFKAKLLDNRRIQEVTIAAEFSYYKSDYEEFSFRIDRERLSQENIQPYQLYAALRPVFGRNIFAGQLATSAGAESIYLTSLQADEYNIWDMRNIPLRINSRDYKLHELAEIDKSQAPPKIVKYDQQYLLCVQYNYIGEWSQANRWQERSVKEFREELPMGYTIESKTGGYFSWSNKEDRQQIWLLGLIFIIIFFISSILFNSLRQPFHIIFVIPISFIGIFLTFYFSKLQFDQGGFASFILLSGITINANIYIINEYNNIRRASPSMKPMRAYLRAWNRKIKPIFLTIISTILGFIPFLVGQYKEPFWYPLAAGTIGGLAVSFVAIFFFLPMFMGVGKKNYEL